MKAVNFKSPVRQRGIAAVMAVIFLITAVIFVLTQTLNISGTTSIDNKQQLNSTAAFFLAESGVENAQAILKTASLNGNYTDATCTGLAGASLGAGTFQYLNPVNYCGATTCTTCGGTSPACTACRVTVKGTVGAASRFISTDLSATSANGVEGYGHTFTLNLKSDFDNSYAFTHLSFNMPSNWGVGGNIGVCTNTSPGVSVTTCSESWNLPGTYYNNTDSEGVFASVPTHGTYSITETLTRNGAPYDEDYVMVGVILQPNSSGTVSHVGSYTKYTGAGITNPGTNCPASGTLPRTMPLTADCSGADYQNGYLDAGWTCNASSGNTANWSNAASANTLFMGFGGKPYSGGSQRTSRLTGVALNGQPIHKQVEMIGTQTTDTGLQELAYSQLWYAYNPDYYSTNNASSNTVNTTGAQIVGTIGAEFTGAVGGVVTACIGNTTNCSGSTPSCSSTGGTLRVCSVASGALRVGDLLSSSGSISNGTTILSQLTSNEPGGTLGLRGTYTVQSQNRRNSATITAQSKILRVTAVSSGQLTAADVITTGISGNPVIQSFSTAGTTGTGLTGEYVLSAQVAPVNTISMQTSSNVLRLVDNTCSGSLNLGDTVISGSTGSGTTYGTLNALNTGIANTAGGTYTLSGANHVATAATTCGSSGANVNMHTDGPTVTTITLAGSNPVPSVGTALAVYSNASTGAIFPDSVTGSVSGTTLTVSAVPSITTVSPGSLVVGTPYKIATLGSTTATQWHTAGVPAAVTPAVGVTFVATATSGGNGTATTIAADLSVGDALFGANIQPNTTITAFGTGTGGTGTYTISPSQTVATPALSTIVARAAVTSVSSPWANSFTVSRPPEVPLVNARLCGGACPFLLGDGVNQVGRYSLTGIIDYDDWSSGFACLRGVDPASIKNLGQVVAKRTRWSEVVQ